MTHNETLHPVSYYQELIMFMAKFSGEYHFGESDGVWIALDCSDGLQVVAKDIPTVYEAIDAAIKWQKKKEERREAEALKNGTSSFTIAWTHANDSKIHL